MKKIILALLLPTLIAFGKPEKKSDDFIVQVCPRMFGIEIPGNLETSEWMDGKGWVWTPIEDYLPVMTDPSKWKTVCSKTDVLKFYIDGITEQCDDAYRKALADLVQETGLEVCVELGGFRMNDGIKKYGDQAGEQAALFEQKKLEPWLRTPGARLDTITSLGRRRSSGCRHLPSSFGKRGPACTGKSGFIQGPGTGHCARLERYSESQPSLGRKVSSRF